MKNALLPVFAAVLLTICSGCVLTPRSQQQTAYYDLPVPQAVKQVNFLQIAAVNNDTPAQSRMLFRKQDNRIVQDYLNCWIQPPERILQRYLTQAFQLQSSKATDNFLELRCSINAFEFDMAKSEAVLSLKCIFRQGSKKAVEVLSVREKFTGRNPEDLVKAMTRATEKMTEAIAQKALKINK